MRPRTTVMLSLLLASAAATVLLTGCGSSGREPEFVGPTLQNPSKAPTFTLTDQHGHAVSLAGLRGKVVLLTFLYTHCPDVCPLTAQNLNTALRRLGSDRTGVDVLAVSVDPAGDTKAAVRAFAREHRLLPQFHYLTGTSRSLERIWRAYGVSAVRNGKDAGVDHTLYTMLVDRQGTARVLFDTRNGTPAAIVHDVRQLL